MGASRTIIDDVPLNFPTEWIDIVSEKMLQLSIPAHLNGYPLIRAGILMTIKDPEVVCMVTKLLYPDLGKLFKTTPSKVERAIRNAIEVSWERGDSELHESIFGYCIGDGLNRPTNSEFLAAVADTINMEHHLRDQLMDNG